MKTIGKDFGDVARKTYAVASGALGNGNTCVVNSDGTVSVVSGASSSVGTAVVFNSSVSYSIGSVFDSNSNRVVVAYKNVGDAQKGYAIVGSVSGSSITFGTGVVFENGGEIRDDAISLAFDSNSNKVVIAYKDANYKGSAIVGTVASGDNSISFGTAVVFHNATVGPQLDVCFDTNENKVVIIYTIAGTYPGKAIVGTVSGTAISFAAEVAMEAGETTNISCTFDSNSNKVVVGYRDNDDSSKSKCIVGTVASGQISFGTAVVWRTTITSKAFVVFDDNSNKVVIVFKGGATPDGGDGDKGSMIVGTVSSTSISFGTAAIFYNAAINYLSATWDSTSNVVIAGYEVGSDYPVTTGTVSGTSISFSAQTALGVNAHRASPTFDSNSNKIVWSYDPDAGTRVGTSKVMTIGSTTLTSENFIGISNAAYAAGQTATIQVAGAINTGQSSLTAGQQYFVQGDGTLGLSADDPSVIAGTAVSATDIIVKG